MRRIVLLACLVLGITSVFAQGVKPIKRTVVDGMNNYVDLKYLSEDRYTGDIVSPRGDYEMMLSLHVPKTGKGPFPVVFYVHGGAWSDYNKEGGQQIAQELASRGIAYCSLNYMLLPKGVWPQIYWDFHNAARFLRKNADKYNIDPLRFGAYGISAGGWLISLASMPNENYWQTGQTSVLSTSQIQAFKGERIIVKKDEDRLGPYGIFKPIHDPAPAWPGEAGGFSALAWDFSYSAEAGDASSPVVQQWVGQGARAAYAEKLTAAGGHVTYTELTNAKFVGKGVHVPPFYNRGSGPGEADALDLDGKPGKTLGVVMVDFFVRELMTPAARPPSPEIYPIPRIINAPTQVTMVAPRGAEIHYTTDGTAPTEASPVYKEAITVKPGTTVKAITVAPAMSPSGANSAEFLAGKVPPTVTGPETLPDGETGKPYSITFTASVPKGRWQINGDLAYSDFRKNGAAPVYPNGMHFDFDAGTWAGTPTKPGKYWVQIWVAEATGMMAGYRNYNWTVTGKELR